MFSLMADKEKKRKNWKESDITYSHYFIVHRMHLAESKEMLKLKW